jgi:LAO/AO transport system kinase
LKTIATRGDGIPELVQAFETHYARVQRDEGRRRHRLRQELSAIFRDRMLKEAETRVQDTIEAEVDRLLARETDPYTVSEALLAQVLKDAE